MKTRIARIGFCLIAIVTVCSAADYPPAVLSNHFSKWSGQSTNLTVSKPCPPWGCSVEGKVYFKAVDPEKESSREVARKALASYHELLRQAQRLERQPNLSTVDHVSLSRQNERPDSDWRVGYGE